MGAHTSALGGLVAGIVAGVVAGVVLGAIVIATVATGGAALAVIGAWAVAIGGTISLGAIGGKIGKNFGATMPAGSPCSKVTIGSHDTFIEDMKAARAEMDTASHGPPQQIACGSATVFVNDRMLARDTDSVKCGGKLISHCQNVWIGGPAGGTPGSEVPWWASDRNLDLIAMGGGGIALLGSGLLFGAVTTAVMVGFGYVGSKIGHFAGAWVGRQADSMLGRTDKRWENLGGGVGEVGGGLVGGFGRPGRWQMAAANRVNGAVGNNRFTGTKLDGQFITRGADPPMRAMTENLPPAAREGVLAETARDPVARAQMEDLQTQGYAVRPGEGPTYTNPTTREVVTGPKPTVEEIVAPPRRDEIPENWMDLPPEPVAPTRDRIPDDWDWNAPAGGEPAAAPHAPEPAPAPRPAPEPAPPPREAVAEVAPAPRPAAEPAPRAPEPAPRAAEPEPAPRAAEPEPAPRAAEPEPAPRAAEPEPAPRAAAPEESPTRVRDLLEADAARGRESRFDPYDAAELQRLPPDTQVQVYLRETGYNRDFNPMRTVTAREAAEFARDPGIERVDVINIPAADRDVTWPYEARQAGSTADRDPSAVRDYIVRYDSGVDARFRGNRDALADLAGEPNIREIRYDGESRGYDLPRVSEVQGPYRAAPERLLPAADGNTPLPATDRPTVGRFTRIVDVKGEPYRFGGDLDPQAPPGELRFRNVELVPVNPGVDANGASAVHLHREVGAGQLLRALRPIMAEARAAGFTRAEVSYGRATHTPDGQLTSVHGAQAHTQRIDLSRKCASCGAAEERPAASELAAAPVEAAPPAAAAVTPEARMASAVQGETNRLLASARQAEPAVTATLKAAAERNQAELVGLENRLKTEESLSRKLGDAARANPDPSVSPERAVETEAANMRDALRYTVQSKDTPGYADTVKNTQQALVAEGNTLVKSKNTWGPDERYRGLNTWWKAPEGQIFEVQFHTPEGYALNKSTHTMYEEWRLPGTPPERKEELFNGIAGIARSIPMPPGAQGL